MKQLLDKYLDGSWDEILSLNIKSTNTVALPFYNVLPTVKDE